MEGMYLEKSDSVFCNAPNYKQTDKRTTAMQEIGDVM